MFFERSIMNKLWKPIGLLGLTILLLVFVRQKEGAEKDATCLTKYLNTSFASVELCIPPGWRLTTDFGHNLIQSEDNQGQISINFVKTQDFTYVQLKPPQSDVFKNVQAWRNKGIYFERIEKGFGPAEYGPATIRYYNYPLRYSTIEIELQVLENKILEEGKTIIESMQFAEIHPMKKELTQKKSIFDWIKRD